MNRRTWLASVGATVLLSRLRSSAARPDLRTPLSVGMSFRWKSETVPHALAGTTEATHHRLANESVFDITVTALTGGERTLLRHTGSQHAFYDPGQLLYTTNPVARSELECLLDARSHATFTVDLSFTLSPFFDAMLAQMTRTDDNLHNLADPEDSAAILSTFEHENRDGKVTVVYNEETHTIRSVPCTLVDIQATQAPSSPAVTLVFEIDFRTGLDAARRQAMRKLIAMDWSGLARVGKETMPKPPYVETWKDNVLTFLANQTDMQRAERMRTVIAARHATKRPRRLADDLRKDLDAHIIAANHWGEPRENMTTEHHQAVLSDLLGRLHQSASPASPIYLSRELTRIHNLDLDQQAAMTLQYGTGFCGEHSRASFSILRTIMSTGGSHIDSIVLCGNANIDHAFVLCNLQVTHVIFTKATCSANTRAKIGDDIKVFNLRDALARTGGHEVFVVDPYLDKSMMKPTAHGLLGSLNSRKKQRRGKDTDFLVFQLQAPVPADFAIEDIRDRSLEERMMLVKNV